MARQQTKAKAALAKFISSDDDTLLADRRAKQLAAHIIIEPSVLDTLREIFVGTDVIEDREKVRKILDVRSEISQSWADARDSFLSIGRALLSLEVVLSKSEFQRLRNSSQRVFPFSDATATQFRQIARAVDSGRIPFEACPGSYGTAYQITLLDDDQLNVARDRGLLRADVTRKEIAALRQESRGQLTASGKVDKTQLRNERKQLRRRDQQLRQEMDIVQGRLAELERLLGTDNEP